ncbi:MAG: hypothetical protein F9B45_18085 [Phycisphaera sp. RhM]|nr:hypothetical protein [Phycisphaera sp. RhM]
MLLRFTTIIPICVLLVCGSLHAAEDLLIEDFEGDSYGKWTVTGDAFGTAPREAHFPTKWP